MKQKIVFKGLDFKILESEFLRVLLQVHSGIYV